MNKPNLPGVLTAITGLLIVVTPNWLLPVCQGMLELANGKQVPMRCFWTARAEMIIGGLVLVTGLMVAFFKSPEARRRLNHQVALLGAVTILTPIFIIPTCANPDMACNVGTKPALILLGGITLALGLYGSRSSRLEPQQAF
jgi:hypothetical protein